MLLLDSPAEWQTVVEEKVHGREREDRAGMARCNVQLNWLDLGSSSIKITHNNQKELMELELGRSAAAAGFDRAHQQLENHPAIAWGRVDQRKSSTACKKRIEASRSRWRERDAFSQRLRQTELCNAHRVHARLCAPRNTQQRG